jgi:quercetin dioxygenase-like cupin family protein
VDPGTPCDHQLPPGTAAAHVEVRRIAMEPSVVVGPHRHHGTVLGSIERGSVVFQVEDEPAER